VSVLWGQDGSLSIGEVTRNCLPGERDNQNWAVLAVCEIHRAQYIGTDGSLSRVASCDIYDFVDGRVARIRSYNG
jgi:hypothetical protein